MSHGADANANQTATANPEPAKEAPPAFGPDDGITTRQGRAVEALLREGSITRAAAAVGVHERTLRRWGKEPAFRAAVLRGRREAFGQAIGLTQRYAPMAVATLVKVMNDPASAASAKVTAAALLLRFAREGVMLDDLAERVERLEEGAAARCRTVQSREVRSEDLEVDVEPADSPEGDADDDGSDEP
jgi:hypothetical protein